MPKHIDFHKLVAAIISMQDFLGVTDLKKLTDAIKRCQNLVLADETAPADLWNLYLDIPPGLRKQFQI